LNEVKLVVKPLNAIATICPTAEGTDRLADPLAALFVTTVPNPDTLV
jgi:hypothetical protein